MASPSLLRTSTHFSQQLHCYRKRSLRPGQCLGTEVKCLKPSISALSELHRPGRNSFAPSRSEMPRKAARRWLAHDKNSTRWPLWPSTLDSAPGPLILDAFLSLSAACALDGTGGYILMSIVRVCISFREQSMSANTQREKVVCCMLSLRTYIAKTFHASKHVEIRISRTYVNSDNDTRKGKPTPRSLVFGQ